MRNLILKFSLVGLLFYCSTHDLFSQLNQDSLIKPPIVLKYQENLKADDVFFDSLVVYFNSEFSDTVQIYLNEKLMVKRQIKTDPVLSYANFKYTIQRDNLALYMKVIYSNKLLSIPIDLHYRYLQISWYKDQWYLYYSYDKPKYY